MLRVSYLVSTSHQVCALMALEGSTVMTSVNIAVKLSKGNEKQEVEQACSFDPCFIQMADLLGSAFSTDKASIVSFVC